MERVIDSPAWPAVRPALSVLIPFHGDDPCPLLRALEAQAALLPGEVEAVVLDDGDPDSDRSAAVAACVASLSIAARLIRLDANEGRARGRNRLVAHARGRHLLFLDSDMALDREDFLIRWLGLVCEDVAVAVGGFSVRSGGRRAALHREMARRADCLPAAVRRRTPEKYVFTSNLLVRRDVFEAEAFDEGFRGWGWEDVEWGMRVSRRWPVIHIDNPAAHLGLDDAATLTAKYEQSAANFARVVAAHPDIVRRYPSFRAAKVLRRAPLRRLWRPLLKRMAIAPGAPLTLRVLAAKTYRAALYAEVV
jgi:glycosyltransferase involved in cell wall biosynthesis